MFCPNCGNQVKEGFNFCKRCGFKLDLTKSVSIQNLIRNVLIRRIEGIKKRDQKVIQEQVVKKKYTKFDDWPPFELQNEQGLKNEAKALKVLENYDYETRSWKIEIFDNSAIAAFIIRYKGKMKDLTFNIQSRVTAFLVNKEGEWKIIHEHWSRFPHNHDQSPANHKPIIL